MIRIKLISENEEHKVLIPQKPNEITLKQMALYLDAVENSPEWFRSIKDIREVSDIDKMRFVLECSKILEKVLDAPFTKAIEVTTGKEKDGLVQTILYLQGVVRNAIEYTPKKRKNFTHNGIEYYLKYRSKDILGFDQNPKFTLHEMILLLATKDRYELLEKTKANFYNKVRTLLAFTARKRGEVLPTSEKQIEDYTKARVKEFENISLDVGLDFWFFFVK